MNERIKQLAEQAGLEFDNDLALEPEPIYYTTQKDLEKFAELIVGECKRAIDPTGDLTSMSEAGWRKACMKMIDEHFKVEE